MRSSIVEGFGWLWDHKPDVAIIVVMVFGAVWLTGIVKNFIRRLESTEQRCFDMQKTMEDRFNKIDERFAKIDDRFIRMDDRLNKIELSLNTITTYLSTKSGNIDPFGKTR